MARTRLLPLLLLAAFAAGQERDAFAVDASWLADSAWNDGKALVSIYRGRIMRYGAWREAEVRDYLIREFFHPEELTKRDREGEDLVPVLKANRMVGFLTGTYPYRRMSSLFFDRRSGRLVKAVGTSQDGCGQVYLRWDHLRRTLRHDSYWEGEGLGELPMPKRGLRFFEEELFVLASGLAEGARVTILPSLTRNRVGAGSPVEVTVQREGRVVRFRDDSGSDWGRFEFDEHGALLRWTIAGQQEFEREASKRLYYWQHHDPGDEEILR